MMEELPEDMEYLKAKVLELQEHTGLIDMEDEKASEDNTKEGSDGDATEEMKAQVETA